MMYNSNICRKPIIPVDHSGMSVLLLGSIVHRQVNSRLTNNHSYTAAVRLTVTGEGEKGQVVEYKIEAKSFLGSLRIL